MTAKEAINLALRQKTRDHANDYKVFFTATEDMFVVFVQEVEISRDKGRAIGGGVTFYITKSDGAKISKVKISK
jgi:hypothetical protein